MTRRERKYIKEFDRYSKLVEARYKPTIKRALDAQVKQFFTYAEQVGLQNALTLIDSVVTQKPIENVLRRLYLVEGKRSGRKEERYINEVYGPELKSYGPQYQTKAFDFFTDWIETLTQFFNFQGFKAVVNITETTRNLLRKAASEGLENGDTLPQIKQRLITEEINERRASVIARTEVITVLNNSNQEAAKGSRLQFIKTWVATKDKRTRDTHRRIDGETQLLEDPFSNGGQYPGDPDLKAKERIQCRCTCIRVAMRDASGRLMRK